MAGRGQGDKREGCSPINWANSSLAGGNSRDFQGNCTDYCCVISSASTGRVIPCCHSRER